ncbi:DUF58 domain-containing protein [Gangjinia marincola]|uniref:DUF58 domain-containing protein n=2 Tax=Gangjinia marincola TaxID=578463 RepID=A0ABP3XW72_9FLAO
MFLTVLVLFILDIAALYGRKQIKGSREMVEKLSNGAENIIRVILKNEYSFPVFVELVDELPVQFQKRDFLEEIRLSGAGNSSAKAYTKTIEYIVVPTERGEYTFGNLNCFVSTSLKLVKRKFIFNGEQLAKVYPSIIEMKKYDFLAMDNRLQSIGLKKIRRIGHTMEFEQIKEYVPGDDVRTINWKATAKQAQLMVNQYQDEKSQPIYTFIDTSRVMKMPFEGLKLVDYAINSTLAFANIALKKNDKVGMLTYAHTVGNYLKAARRTSHLSLMLETLYNINTKHLDSDLGLLYGHINRKITQRSLLIMFTNFEHISAMRRQLPYLKAISKRHVLVVVFFENTELRQLIESNPSTIGDVYDQTIANQFAMDKQLIAKELNQYGIQTVLTPPAKLTVNTINKYLEIKARGLL